jgi:NAD(P)H-quinone oxidoreductase subunit 5
MTTFFLQTIWVIPFYGILGALLVLPWGLGLIQRTGQRPAAYLNLVTTLLALGHELLALPALQGQPAQHLSLHWLKIADLDVTLDLEVSGVSMAALTLVSSMMLLTQVFGLGYMEKDWALARFYGLLGFFEGALSGLVLSDSLLLSYGLLEMLTLSTYLLVGFWYAQAAVVTAARDAFLTKRVGDVFLLMGVVTLACLAPGLTFSDLGNWAMEKPLAPWAANLIGLALIAGPVGKCAQFPLNLWLDEAMEGPNPASLLRNSVVVASGAYVLIKLQPLLTISPLASNVLITIGAITAIGSSLVAIAQIDIKRALCHSTSAYMGLVFIATGFQRTDIALLLIVAHGVSKALMFMSVGSVILTTNNQDITELGGLANKMPATTLAFGVGMMGILGVLPFGMFWTLQRWVAGTYSAPPWLVVLLALVNALSALNLTRVFRLVFLDKAQAKTRRAPEVSWLLAVPMVSLMIVVLVLPLMVPGWMLSTIAASESLVPMGMILVAGIAGITLGMTRTYSRQLSRPINPLARFIQDLLAYDFYLDVVYKRTVVKVVSLSSAIAAWFDRYIVDGLVNLVGIATLLSGQSLRYSASGQSQGYVITIVLGVGAMLVLITGITRLWDDVAAAAFQMFQ